jgi:hypothetical protein
MTVAVAMLSIGVALASCGASSQPSALARSVHSSSTTNAHTPTSVRPTSAKNPLAVPVPASNETPLVQKDQNRVTEAQNKIEGDNGRLLGDQELAEEDATQCSVEKDEVQQDEAERNPSLSSAEGSAQITCSRAQAAAEQVSNDKAQLSKDQTNLNGAEAALSRTESGG